MASLIKPQEMPLAETERHDKVSKFSCTENCKTHACLYTKGLSKQYVHCIVTLFTCYTV